jgi:hypothetical protein
VLKFQQIVTAGDNVVMQFLATSNRTYSVLHKLALTDAGWLKLVDVPAHPTNRMASVTNSMTGEASRFYRLATPAQP